MVTTGSDPVVAGPSSLVDVTRMQRHHCRTNVSSSMPPRRQSDSTLTGKERVHLDEDGRAKLRRWAAEALEAPPPFMDPCEPTQRERPLQSAASLGRSTRPRSKSPVASTSRLDPDEVAPRRKSLFAEQILSPGALSSLSVERPHSSTTTPTAPTFPSSATMVPSASSPALGLAQRRMQSGRLEENLVQQITTPLPDLQLPKGPTAALASETTPRPRISPNGSAAAHHPSALPRLKTVKLQEPATPRAYDSPRSTTSTCESDDDGAFVMTPLDGALPTRFDPPLASAGHGTPPLDTLSDAPANRVGSSLGLETLGRSHDESPITTYLASGRRGSQSQSPVDPLANRGSRSGASANAPPVPPLSRSTLIDLGAVKGLTPPYLTEVTATSNGHAVSSAAESSSVVSAGLEMGLGVSMATAALTANLPVHASGLGNFADPRHARRHAARGPMHGEGPKTTDSEVSSSLSRSHADEVRYGSVDSPDLSRRRTTGWDAAKARRDLGKRHRAETHDEIVSRRQGSHQHAATTMPVNGDGFHSPLRPVISLLPHASDLSEASRPSGSSTVSSFDSRDTQARASRTGSTQIDTPSLSGRAMLSPDVNPLVDVRGGMFGGGPEVGEDVRVTKAREAMLRDAAYGAQASGGNNGGLMGSNVGGHFGPGVRAKVIEVLDPLIASVPMTGEDGETINLVEYGCLNSRSIPVMQLIISKFAKRAAALHRRSMRELDTVDEGKEMRHHERGALDARHHRHIEPEHSRANFTVLHEDLSTSDFRPVIQSLDSRAESYLDSQWQATHRPSLQDSVFSSFVGRPFASRVAPPKTMHFGISLMDMHWTHTPINAVLPMATTSHAELTTFLRARSHEFKTGGVLIVAFLARSEDAASLTRQKSLNGSGSGTSGASKPQGDIWTKLTTTLAPCIQRLVSCGMLKSDVARFLLDLPLHPRTPRQTCNALNSLRNLWSVEWSCGLGQDGPTATTTTNDASSLPLPASEPQPLRIAHPAWKAFEAGTLSKVALTEHMLMLFKNLYEAHFRTVLRERGKLSKGAAEFVLDSLWDILSSKIDDQHPHSPMEEVEIEVSICALRRL